MLPGSLAESTTCVPMEVDILPSQCLCIRAFRGLDATATWASNLTSFVSSYTFLILERPVPPRGAAGGVMRAGSQGLAGDFLNTPPSCPLFVNSRAVSMDERGEGGIAYVCYTRGGSCDCENAR